MNEERCTRHMSQISRRCWCYAATVLCVTTADIELLLRPLLLLLEPTHDAYDPHHALHTAHLALVCVYRVYRLGVVQRKHDMPIAISTLDTIITRMWYWTFMFLFARDGHPM